MGVWGKSLWTGGASCAKTYGGNKLVQFQKWKKCSQHGESTVNCGGVVGSEVGDRGRGQVTRGSRRP